MAGLLRSMIAFAQAQAARQRLSNATFAVMDVLKPLGFPEQGFDLVTLRLAATWLPRSSRVVVSISQTLSEPVSVAIASVAIASRFPSGKLANSTDDKKVPKLPEKLDIYSRCHLISLPV